MAVGRALPPVPVGVALPRNYGFARPTLVESAPGLGGIIDGISARYQWLYRNAPQAYVVKHFLQVGEGNIHAPSTSSCFCMTDA